MAESVVTQMSAPQMCRRGHGADLEPFTGWVHQPFGAVSVRANGSQLLTFPMGETVGGSPVGTSD